MTVRASVDETLRRVEAVYTADHVPIGPIAITDAADLTKQPVVTRRVSATVTTAPVFSQDTTEYFYRATITGSDSLSTVTLAMLGRLITRVAPDPEARAGEISVAASCLTQPPCAAYLQRMREHAAKLRQ